MKKKGLIISTIVMVVVLIASLTTATYAWFSSQADVTITNLNIQASATNGLQIAIKTTADSTYTTGYTYGTVDYAEGSWTSAEEADGFGNTINFANVAVGTISNAVTNQAATGAGIPTTSKYVYTEVELTGAGSVTTSHYTLSAKGEPSQCEAGDPEPGTKYYTRAAVADGTYYMPTGYNAEAQPLGFFAVDPNDAGTYYDLPIRVKSTADIKAIVCKLSITDNSGSKAFSPGMAAATRVKLGLRKGEEGAETVHTGYTPYSSAVSGVSGMTSVVAAEGSFAFVVAVAQTSSDKIVSTDVYTIHVILWVEGTDPECNNNTTSATNFNVGFSFKYTTDQDDVNIAGSKVTIDAVDYAILAGTVIEHA